MSIEHIKAAILQKNHHSDMEVSIRDFDRQYSVEVSGAGFTQAESLLQPGIGFLAIRNTGIAQTVFLSQAPLNPTVKWLFLKNNDMITDRYAGLAASNIPSIAIANSDNFTDVSVFGPHTGDISLSVTGIKELSFRYPQAINHLELHGNAQLSDITKINELHQLNSLRSDQLDGIDFTNLPNLQFFYLGYSDTVREIPQLHRQSIRQLGVDHCPNLQNIESLKNMTVKKIQLVAITEKQLRLFTPVLLTMQIETAIILMDKTPADELIAPLRKITGLKQLWVTPQPPTAL